MIAEAFTLALALVMAFGILAAIMIPIAFLLTRGSRHIDDD